MAVRGCLRGVVEMLHDTAGSDNARSGSLARTSSLASRLAVRLWFKSG
jgi:hypothetical protein